MTLIITQYMCGKFVPDDIVWIRWYGEDNVPTYSLATVARIFSNEYIYVLVDGDPNVWTVHNSCVFCRNEIS